ncbi:MAG TPA: hypothetical protein ENH85_08200 [Candidatus Scalindua sp.]|nr:hypothetical protein [Candidatus Scalindua sp.]
MEVNIIILILVAISFFLTLLNSVFIVMLFLRKEDAPSEINKPVELPEKRNHQKPMLKEW